MKEKEGGHYQCPKCLDDIASKIGITSILLLNLLDAVSDEDGTVRVNGYSSAIGHLSPVYEGLTGGKGALLAYSGMSSCGHTISYRQEYLLLSQHL